MSYYKTGFRGHVSSKAKIGIETNSFIHTNTVKPMRLVDLIAESEEATGIKRNTEPVHYESDFLKNFRRSLNACKKTE